MKQYNQEDFEQQHKDLAERLTESKTKKPTAKQQVEPKKIPDFVRKNNSAG